MTTIFTVTPQLTFGANQPAFSAKKKVALKRPVSRTAAVKKVATKKKVSKQAGPSVSAAAATPLSIEPDRILRYKQGHITIDFMQRGNQLFCLTTIPPELTFAGQPLSLLAGQGASRMLLSLDPNGKVLVDNERAVPLVNTEGRIITRVRWKESGKDDGQVNNLPKEIVSSLNNNIAIAHSQAARQPASQHIAIMDTFPQFDLEALK